MLLATFLPHSSVTSLLCPQLETCDDGQDLPQVTKQEVLELLQGTLVNQIGCEEVPVLNI